MTPSPSPPQLLRQELVQIATDNQQRLNNGTLSHGASTVHAAPQQPLPPLPATASPTRIAVADCDTVTAAIALAQRAAAGAPPPAVLNFANASQRGGGYITGARAQEEDLCRVIPALYSALQQLVYPLDPATVPASSVAICRAPGTYAMAPFATPVVVLTAAALDMRPVIAGQPQVLPTASAYDMEMRRRARVVLHAAHAVGCRDIVLGAWGCGVFQNDATAVANVFAAVLATSEWRCRFDTIIFAIPGRGRGAAIRRIFATRLGRLTH